MYPSLPGLKNAARMQSYIERIICPPGHTWRSPGRGEHVEYCTVRFHTQAPTVDDCAVYLSSVSLVRGGCYEVTRSCSQLGVWTR